MKAQVKARDEGDADESFVQAWKEKRASVRADLAAAKGCKGKAAFKGKGKGKPASTRILPAVLDDEMIEQSVAKTYPLPSSKIW